MQVQGNKQGTQHLKPVNNIRRSDTWVKIHLKHMRVDEWRQGPVERTHSDKKTENKKKIPEKTKSESIKTQSRVILKDKGNPVSYTVLSYSYICPSWFCDPNQVIDIQSISSVLLKIAIHIVL